MTSKGFVAILAGTAAALAIAVPAAFGAEGDRRQRHRRQAVGARFTLSKKSRKGSSRSGSRTGARTHDFKIAGKVTKS